MSREIVILRHAQAAALAPGQRDLDRSLTAHGVGEADAVARWFGEHALAFDRVLCSPAQRARQTAERVLGSSARDIVVEPRIYEATPGALIGVLDDARDCARVLLVGHNPGLEQLVALLADGRSEVAHGLPTAGVARLSIPSGQALEPGVATLRAFWSP
jgi:phosphohistidine phosphatase SixA